VSKLAAGGIHFDTATGSSLYATDRSGLQQWPIKFASQGGGPIVELRHPENLSRTVTYTFAFDRAQRRVAAIKGQGVLLWDLEHTNSTAKWCAHGDAARVSIEPSGKWVATGTWKGNGVKVWEFSTGQLVRDLPVTGSANVAFSPDGKWLATVNATEHRLWDTTSWAPQPQAFQADPIWLAGALEFSPDSRLLATCHDPWQIQLVKVPELRPVARIHLPAGRNFLALRFTPDGAKLAALDGPSGAIYLWDLSALRAELRALNLDWDFPPLPSASEALSAGGPKLLLDAGPFSRQELAEKIPPRDANVPANLIDLTGYYNAPLTQNWHFVSGGRQSNLSELPLGLQRLAGVEFDVRGLIQTGHSWPDHLSYPERVDCIRIAQSCRRLHFLHAAIAGGSHAGDKLGRYIVQYADGREVEIPIVAGNDLSDWWSQSNEEALKFVIAWQGNTPQAQKYGHSVRLFKSTWENPYPTMRLRQFDFIADDPSRGAPFLVAVTAEP
jgi:hypothetical protein